MKVISIIVVSLLIVSCNTEFHDSISGNGKVNSRTVGTDTISRLIISDKLDAVIIPSAETKVELIADENLHDIISCEINRGILKVTTDKFIRMAKSKEVWIYTPCISQIEASAKSSVNIRDSLSCDDLNVITSSAAEVRINGSFETLTVNASSGSAVHIAGKTAYLNINASSASDIFAFDLKTIETDVSASSAADVRITVKDKARFSASSASDIRYRGEPVILDSRSSSLGDIRRVKF